MDNRDYVKRKSYRKPDGLWITTDNENNWKDWCEENCFNLENLKVRNEFKIIDTSKILYLETLIKFDMFSRSFSIADSCNINWEEVSNKWDGIIIPFYFYERRFDPIWYYGWDCSTGCIWNTSILKEL